MGFVNYTKQLFLNGYASTCLVIVDNLCMYMHRNMMHLSSVLSLSNTSVTKSYLCVYYVTFGNASMFEDLSRDCVYLDGNLVKCC